LKSTRRIIVQVGIQYLVERAEVVWKALHLFERANADFADCLIGTSAAAAGCEQTMTFDRGAVKNSGMTLARRLSNVPSSSRSRGLTL
jgi:predicted nucleic-acid-binding protein